MRYYKKRGCNGLIKRPTDPDIKKFLDEFKRKEQEDRKIPFDDRVEELERYPERFDPAVLAKKSHERYMRKLFPEDYLDEEDENDDLMK
ncbi:hypothetical protein [Methanobrevibacter filiformis]|uniref:Uncharacterized protein n=1 Tax=Methanobrevibacter filiformis TaxID=55758 RepID=A0A166DBV3_9EURY|nr:hypothetical protein [Methanobrevibacter filiformis]KZX15423.1 hypothetical protein MBFIL_06420 [Methanobrevibacter filiformis]